MTGMTSSGRTGRFPLILSIALTCALTALLALGPTHGEAQALSLATVDGDAPAAGSKLRTHPHGTAGSLGQMSQAAWTTYATSAEAGADGQATVFVRHIWYAAADFLGIAPDDGSLSEWAPHYFVAHSFGGYGQAILALQVGDAIVVNGSLVEVEGAVTAPKYTAYDQIMDAVGWDATVFQTCIPDTESCLFVYARGAASTTDAANEARTFAGLPPFETYGTDGTGWSYAAYAADGANGAEGANVTYDSATPQASDENPSADLGVSSDDLAVRVLTAFSEDADTDTGGTRATKESQAHPTASSTSSQQRQGQEPTRGAGTELRTRPRAGDADGTLPWARPRPWSKPGSRS